MNQKRREREWRIMRIVEQRLAGYVNIELLIFHENLTITREIANEIIK